MDEKRLILCAGLVASLSSLGCSKTHSSGAHGTGVVASVGSEGGPPPAACALTTDADMTAALGTIFAKNPNQPTNSYGTVSVCHYHSTGLTLTVRTETLDKSGFEANARNLPGAEALADFGDAAYFQATGRQPVLIGTLLVLEGKTMLGITYGGTGVDHDRALSAEKALAARLLPKL